MKRRPLRDASSRNAFVKFETAVTKKYEQQLAEFSEEEYRQLEYLQDLFAFLDEIIPEDDEDEVVELPKRGGRKRQVGSSGETSSEADNRFTQAVR